MSRLIRQVMAITALSGAILVAGAAVLYGTPAIVLGVFAGVALALGNTLLMNRHVARLFDGDLSGFSLFLFVFKLAALAATLYALIVQIELNALAILAGFTTLAFAVTVSALGALRGPATSAE